jgi:hypothetical protein
VDDDPALAGLLNDPGGDERPALGVGAGQPGDLEPLGLGAGVVEGARVGEVVVQDEVGLPEALDGPEGEQAHVAGAGADEVHATDWGGGRHQPFRPGVRFQGITTPRVRPAFAPKGRREK